MRPAGFYTILYMLATFSFIVERLTNKNRVF